MGKKAQFFTYALGGLGLTAVVAAIAVVASPGFAEGRDGDRHHGRGDGRHMFSVLNEMDADGNGMVTRAETEAFNAARAAAIDSNGDGEVTVDELAAFREAQQQKRMAAHLASMDSDGDGKVSVAELQSASNWRLARLDRDGDGVIEIRKSGRHQGPGPGHGPMQGPDDDAGSPEN